MFNDLLGNQLFPYQNQTMVPWHQLQMQQNSQSLLGAAIEAQAREQAVINSSKEKKSTINKKLLLLEV